MLDVITVAVKAVTQPVKSLFYDWIQDYVNLIRSYDANMTGLVDALHTLCRKKQDIDAEVMEGKERLRVLTKETAFWLKSLNELIVKDEMKVLMKEDRVAIIVVKMMEQHVMKKLLKDDREVFDIVVKVVMNKCNPEAVNGEGVDVAEKAEYKKVAKIAMEVMKGTAEEFKKFLVNGETAIAAFELLNDADFENFSKDDDEMAKILCKAEGISRMKLEHNDHDEVGKNVEPVDKNLIKEKVRIWYKHIGSLMAFLNDKKFKKVLPHGAKFGLEVMDALSKQIGVESVENSEEHMYCGWCIVRFEGYRYCHDMSKRAEIMIKAVRSMIDGCQQRPLTRRIRADELEDIANEFIEGLESREEIMHKILTAFKDDQVNAVGVFGMGGSGKTTLAKELASKRAGPLFDKILVVEVSEVPNIKGIQDQIAGGISLPLDDAHNVAQRARILYNGLKSERKRTILIILDNMWKKLKLDQVGIPRESTKDFCCKLLITTRERQVCRAMDVSDAYIFEVGLLNQREAINLFENQSGKKLDGGEYKPVVDKLLMKCGGLPLAIVAAGNALKGKDLPMWCRFAEESEKPISSQVSSEYREAYSILETSYKLMDIEEKKIFFFLACLSPLDSAISVDELMRYGIGLDLFQHVNKLSEAMEQASAWTNELVSSSLLLKDDSDGHVKIHDVVRASAISFADRGKDRMTLVERIPRWMCKETFKKVTAISLLSGHDFSRLSGVKAPMLQILLLKGDVSSTTLTSTFFRGMTNLKVLSLSSIDFQLGLPKSIGQLKRLKTLHLQHCRLKDIKMIGKLASLLVLSLHGSTLDELADEIGELCNLRLLDMGSCKVKISIAANVLSRLSHLEGLYVFNGFNDWESVKIKANDRGADKKASVSELNKLSHLNVLELEAPETEQLLTLNDGLFNELSNFRIHVGNFDERDLKSVQPFHRVLELNNLDASQNKHLRELLKRTDCLQVMGKESLIENFVPQLDEEGFKDLKSLEVKDLKHVKFIISSKKQSESMAFVNLELLRLDCLWDLELICDGKAPAGLFSNLRCLTLSGLEFLKYGLPLVPPNLVEVFVKCCASLRFIFFEDSFLQKENDIVELRFLKSLKVNSMYSLLSVLGQVEMIDDRGCESCDNQSFFNAKIIFPSLDNLNLSWNGKCVTLWSKTCRASSFQNLKVMVICKFWKLESLGSPYIFAALVQLEDLSIEYCDKIQEVITKETEVHKVCENIIVFPLLKRLCMRHLSSLKRFYGGSYKLEFPILKSLVLSGAESLINFDGPENSTAIFSDKIEFPCLEELEVLDVSDKIVRLWNWSSSRVQGESESGSNSLKPVPNLQKLTLCKTRGLTSIPPFVSRNLSYLEVTKYDDIKTLFSTLLANREVLWTYSQLSNLKDLRVGLCDSLEDLFQNEDDDAAISLFERLTGLELENMPKLKMIPVHLLKNIRSLVVSKLNWTYAFTGDLFIGGLEQLPLLKHLVIDRCTNMEVIIMDELVGDGEDRFYAFSRLKSLTLIYLDIINFASNSSAALHFPSLEHIEITKCYKSQSFCAGPFRAPKLKQVVLHFCSELQYFLSGNKNEVQELPSLESVTIISCKELLSFSSGVLAAPELHNVTLEGCVEMERFSPGGPNPDDILELPSLESVSIRNCSGMKFAPMGIKAPKLSELEVGGIDYSKRANYELQRLLVKLPPSFSRF